MASSLAHSSSRRCSLSDIISAAGTIVMRKMSPLWSPCLRNWIILTMSFGLYAPLFPSLSPLVSHGTQDIEHTNGKRYFTWDSRTFPTPIEMQKSLSAHGRKMVTIVDPHIKRDDQYAPPLFLCHLSYSALTML
jgi:hypothetical protein